MICNKCGRTIDDTAKFCTYCGNPVSMSQTNNNESINTNVVNNNESVNSFNNVTEVQTNQVNNQNSYMNYQTNNTINNQNSTLNNVEPVVNNAQQNINEQERVVEPSVQNLFGNQRQINNPNNYTGEDMYKPVINNTPVVNPQTVSTNNTEKQQKKINKLVYIIGGSVLGLIVIALVVLYLINGSNNSIKVLEHAIGNFKNTESATIRVKATLESKTEDKLNISASAKYNKTDTGYDMSLTLDKSILFDEINAYANIVGKKLNLFVESNTIDMLGLTSSDANMWLYYIQDIEDIKEQVNSKTENGEIKLDSIIDKDHFKYIDKKDNLKHYQLIVDQELVNKIKAQATEEEKEIVEGKLDSITNTESMKEKYKLDFYINGSNELEKISIDLTDKMGDNDYKSAILSIEFIDINKTKVTIPKEALESSYDITSYMSAYTKMNTSNDNATVQE